MAHAPRHARKRAFTPDPSLRRDIAQEITDQIVALLETGDELPWRQPWRSTGARLPLRHDGTAYRGINVFLLGLRAMGRGYSSPYWMSFKQALELGAAVRKGERGTTVVYYGVTRKQAADDVVEIGQSGDGAVPESEGTRRFLKHYTAFNAEQIDGLPERYHPARETDAIPGPSADRRLGPIADAMTEGLGVGYEEGGDRACYIPGLDRIMMPPIHRFRDAEAYYATRFHECAHATEVASRLNINYGGKSFGNEAYAKGELYAEITASLLGAILGFSPDHIENHAAYVQSWLKVLRSDKRFILKAAADAQRGADYLLAAAAADRVAAVAAE